MVNLIKLCLGAALLFGCAASQDSKLERARVAACIAESKIQTQQDKQACRELRAACEERNTRAHCIETACNAEQIEKIFADANERELSCLAPR